MKYLHPTQYNILKGFSKYHMHVHVGILFLYKSLWGGFIFHSIYLTSHVRHIEKVVLYPKLSSGWFIIT